MQPSQIMYRRPSQHMYWRPSQLMYLTTHVQTTLATHVQTLTTHAQTIFTTHVHTGNPHTHVQTTLETHVQTLQRSLTTHVQKNLSTFAQQRQLSQIMYRLILSSPPGLIRSSALSPLSHPHHHSCKQRSLRTRLQNNPHNLCPGNLRTPEQTVQRSLRIRRCLDDPSTHKPTT
jgi:hypothetical protein